ncbi:short-chain dehydrogenase [Primorskyibacter flagellatus]|uniref:Short-chain dehydrogenase n=1 Tax=Primorskyibacter flagellatus TaxID=1387277 RepID=A0A917A7G0_9RHOB|nr:SDR family oxidoreductase [Primorskyibacter flagellatus]GGE31817.1 short-chain dehydrogenase [Primorskyibacter flagellatus]
MKRTILITGASSGIGAACARLAAARDTHLILHYGRNRTGAEDVADAARINGAEVTLIGADLSDPAQIERLGQEAAESDPALPFHLINNAGIVDARASLEDLTAERMTRMFAVNTIGAILVAQQAVALMRRQGRGGSIVNVSSVAARKGMGGQYMDYAASKAAIDCFTIGLADELAPERIRVNAVRPGLIETEIHAKGGEPDRMARIGHEVPLGRPGTAEEVAESILWLLSDKASYVTRTIVDVAGGR